MTLREYLYLILAYIISTLFLVFMGLWVATTEVRAEVNLQTYFAQGGHNDQYGQGFAHGLLTAMAIGRNVDMSQICFPGKTVMSSELAVKLLERHWQQHPQEAVKTLPYAMYGALATAFPCNVLVRKSSGF